MASLAAIGSVISSAGTLFEGKAAQEDAYFQAAQLKAKGVEEFAAGQRAAAEKRKETELALSRSQALAAASGAGTGGSVLESEMDIAQRGELLARDEMFRAEQRKKGLFDQAKAARRTGLAARRGSYFKAAGTLLEGVAKAYSGSGGGGSGGSTGSSYG